MRVMASARNSHFRYPISDIGTSWLRGSLRVIAESPLVNSIYPGKKKALMVSIVRFNSLKESPITLARVTMSMKGDYVNVPGFPNQYISPVSKGKRVSIQAGVKEEK